MAQSSSELNTIHLRRLATPGRRYFGDDERVYIGTSDGRLKLEDKAKETSFKPTSTISETNVQDAIENLSSGSNIGSLLTDTATIDFTYNSVVPASITADLKNTTVTAAVYGSATQSPTITIDAQGRITNAVNTAIAIAPGVISLTTNQILVGGAGNLAFDVAMSGEASIVAAGTVTLLNSAVIGKVLTGYVSGAGVLAATDTILQAFNKLNGNIAALVTGVSSVTGTLNRITTSPTTGAVIVDIAATYVGQTSLTTLGTISTGTWNGSVISPVYGGTGIANNVASTLAISGAFATTLTVTGVTGVTLPLSGTLYGTLANSITSAQLASSLTDETGTLLAVFSDSPTFTTQITAPLIIGGTAVGSLITYKSTTGVGTTSAIGHEFTGGTNGGTTIARLYNNGSIDIGTAAADIAATNLSISKTITGGVNAYGVHLNSTIQSGVTSIARMYLSAPSTVASVFNVGTLIHFQTVSNTFGAGSTVSTQIGFQCSDLTTATVNYGFRGAVSSGTDKYNCYMSGTAQNYFAGNVGIGQTTPTAVLHLKAGTATASTGPLKLTSQAIAALLATPEAGVLEFSTDNYYLTGTTGATRKTIQDLSYRAITALRTLDGSDEFIDCTANTFTLTLPTAVGYSKKYKIKNSGTGIITLATTGGQTVDGNTSGALTLIQYDSVILRSNGSNWLLEGDYSKPHIGVLSVASQTISVANTPQVVTFGTTILASKIVATTSSRFTVNEAGNYNIQLSLQAASTAGANKQLDIWFRVNGSDVTNSNSIVKLISTNDEKQLTIAMGIALTAGQYLEVWMSGDSTNIQLQYTAAGAAPTRPVTPSVFLTIDKLP